MAKPHSMRFFCMYPHLILMGELGAFCYNYGKDQKNFQYTL